MGGVTESGGGWGLTLSAALFLLASAPAKAEETDKPKVKVGARVFARASADGREQFQRQWSVPLARIVAEGSMERLDATVEADLASKQMLKDAWLRLRDSGRRYHLWAGQFKAPFLERELESRWDLPLIRRGVVNNFVVNQQGLGGRRLGAMGEVKLKKLMRFNAQLGAFAGERTPGTPAATRTGEDLAARVSFRPLEVLTLGANAYVADAVGSRSRRAGAMDATLRWGPAAFTGEGVVGRVGSGPFSALLSRLTWDIALTRDATWVLQPLAAAEHLQLRGARPGQGYAGTLGLNLDYSDRFRLMLQAERALRPGDVAANNEVSLQAGARF